MKRGSRPYLNLLWALTLSEHRLRDQNTFFGFAWSFLHPLVMLGVLFMMFSARLGRDIEHYPIYLLIGLIQYTHFANSTGAAMRVLSSMRKLVTDAIFPKEILVFATVLSEAFEFVLSFIVCLLIALVTGVPLHGTSAALPAVILLQLLMVLWVSLLLACLHVTVRDVEHMYQVFLRVLLFITPIFYGQAFLGDGPGRWLVVLNPLAHLMGFSRSLMLEGTWFPPRVFLAHLAINVLLLFVSLRIFRRCERRFAEVV